VNEYIKNVINKNQFELIEVDEMQTNIELMNYDYLEDGRYVKILVPRNNFINFEEFIKMSEIDCFHKVFNYTKINQFDIVNYYVIFIKI
jgi:hypothetical protein